ncbi:MAG: hypothetical protein JO016_20290 [Actinobacteria bacterium]|nr:hypothetical protein [Actinomycetota bacterium]
MTDGSPARDGTYAEDRHLRRQLGFWPLTAIAVSGVIGSGWLLPSLSAIATAGVIYAYTGWPCSSPRCPTACWPGAGPAST